MPAFVRTQTCASVAARVTRGDYQAGLGGGLGAFAGGDAARERVAPPLLRLDALDTILGKKEWDSSPTCSPHVTATLSAASTRPPAHLVSFPY